MSKHTPKPPELQPKLFEYSEALNQLDKRVRTTHIGAEQYVSVLDILEYHGNKKNPAQAWKTTLDFMERQGFGSSPFFGQHKFEGQGQRLTPVVNLDGFLRLVQSAEVPEWEPIRKWLSHIGAEQIKSNAQRKRESTIATHKKHGLGNRPEIQHLEAYNEALKEYAELKSTYARLVDNPDWAMLANAEYFALFGMFSKQLKEALNNDNIRKGLDTDALETLAFAERRLRSVLATQQNLTNERIQEIIQVVVSPLGVYLRGIKQLQGLSLLGSGK